MPKEHTVYVTVRLSISIEDGVEGNDFLNEMDYKFKPRPWHGKVLDSEILVMGAEFVEEGGE